MRLPLRRWRGDLTHLNFQAGQLITPIGRVVKPIWGQWVSPLCVVAIFSQGFYFAWRQPSRKTDRRWALALRTRGL